MPQVINFPHNDPADLKVDVLQVYHSSFLYMIIISGLFIDINFYETLSNPS